MMRLADLILPPVEMAQRAFSGADKDVESIHSRLIEALDAARASVLDQGYTDDQAAAALFAVVAWIDEQAQTQDWPGAAQWRTVPLQRHYFSTNRAGVLFYQRLEELPDDAVALREVYSLMLLLGFTGRFATAPHGELERYRRSQFQHLVGAAALRPLDAQNPLFPEAEIGQSAAPRARRRLIRPNTMLVLLIGLPLCVLALMYAGYAVTLSSIVGSFLSRLS